MAKMTPEQEAQYALDFGVARSDLPKDAQLAYDRQMEQRARAATRASVSPGSAKAARPVHIGCLVVLLVSVMVPVMLAALIMGGLIIAGFDGPKDITPSAAQVTGTWIQPGGATVVLKANGTFTASHLPAQFGEWGDGEPPSSGTGTWRVGRFDPSTEPGVILSFPGPGLGITTELLVQWSSGSPLIMYYDPGGPDEGVSGQYQLIKQK
jgi:hypothetical protein